MRPEFLWHQSERGALRYCRFAKMEARETGSGLLIHFAQNGTGACSHWGNKSRGFTVYILKDGEYSKIVNGEFEITGHGINNEIIVADNDTDFVLATPGDIWRIPAHDATQYGSRLIGNIFSDRRFTFPKSLFAVKDCLYFLQQINLTHLLSIFLPVPVPRFTQSIS